MAIYAVLADVVYRGWFLHYARIGLMWLTPALVLAEDGDAESLELYRALEGRGVESGLLRTGRSPGDMVRDWEAVLAWLGR